MKFQIVVCGNYLLRCALFGKTSKSIMDSAHIAVLVAGQGEVVGFVGNGRAKVFAEDSGRSVGGIAALACRLRCNRPVVLINCDIAARGGTGGLGPGVSKRAGKADFPLRYTVRIRKSIVLRLCQRA